MATRFVTFVATVLFLTGLLVGTLRAEDPPPVQTDAPATTTIGPGMVEVPLDAPDGLPIVTAQINGRGPFRILIDTASRRMVVDDDLIRSAALKPSGTTRLPDAAGDGAGQLPAVRIETVAMGTALFSGIDAAVVDLDREEGRTRRYDAVAGLPFFTDCVVTINYAGGNVLLQKGALPEPDGRHVLAYTLERGRPMITVGVGDRKFAVGLETAADAGLTLAPKDRQRVPTGTLLGLAGDPKRFISDVDMVTPRTKDPITLAGVKLSTVPVSAGSSSSSLGREVLQLFTIAFDEVHGRVRFQSSTNAIDMTPVSRYGYVFSRQDDGLVVVAIFPGSIAERQALLEGDYIRTVERKLASTYTDDDLRQMLRTARTVLFIVDKQGLPLMVVANSTDH